MVKEMRSVVNPFSPLKHNNVIIKFAVSFLLVGLAFHLLVSDSFRFSSVVETPVPANEETEPESLMASLPAEEPLSNDFAANESQTSQPGKCDLFVGDWIPDPSGPFYTNQSCLQIEGHQNCMKNGRSDSGYLHWRWNPRGCSLPRFNPKKFLRLMRNKSWAFIGDSISRNHVQSLLCTLSQVEQAVEVYHDEEYRSKIWRFPSHNFTLSVIWTPFLIKADIFEDMNGVSSSEIQLHLDKLDKKWTDQYRNLDYAIIAGGKWFLKTAIYHENNVVTGCHYCPGKNLTELGFDYAYRKAMQLIFNFITNSGHKALAFFRTTTPDHFENGEWFSGGTCNRKVPFKEDEVSMTDVDTIMHNIELEEFEKATALGPEKGVALKLLDTTRLSLLRPDGHPGPYRQFQPFAEDKNAQVQNDCLHWCLPGPIDSWNDLVMEMIVNGGI
ncbi:protein trichome birefringence-like 25 [Populus alba x Populus x berolinensis]|uniref:Protein trichome birefringence-like 25 n=1 Tax=Populus alba x Populus x berolinensis TaxID=444605 RepID=A0AAD6PYP7_9ROSI|nr:protein trichome birefringence-like 25 [Populus alba x Populus x berolinensis]